MLTAGKIFCGPTRTSNIMEQFCGKSADCQNPDWGVIMTEPQASADSMLDISSAQSSKWQEAGGGLDGVSIDKAGVACAKEFVERWPDSL
jgi:hypothetical protein